MTSLSGGCQCGAVRFRAGGLKRPSICHCRMCQKAFAAPFGALVVAEKVEWTRGAPKHFRSSEKVRRGFCGECGTPLTYEYLEAEYIDLAICAFDDPAAIPPETQLAEEQRIPWCEGLETLSVRTPEQKAKYAPIMAANRSFQHPDHDTTDWKPRS
ncbi:MAG: aldehyde-activating protein [Methylobacterium sp.]|nr:MAG: aldehyde-activating protein [Methylobacterium sp.]